MRHIGAHGRARKRAIAGLLIVAVSGLAGGSVVDGGAHAGVYEASAGSAGSAGSDGSGLDGRGWAWPLPEFRIERHYEAPAHRYAAGHRGIDLRSFDGLGVRAPADGIVAFSGAVAGRGILTIDHGDGLVTTLEPIDSLLAPGEVVERGTAVGAIALGGHAAPGSLHFGVRLDGEYINPMLLLGGVPRAVLLPCC